MSEKSFSLIVEVLKASNLPKHKSKPDPYVCITYRSIKKKTGIKKSDLNPEWNEKFEFDLLSPIGEGDAIEIEIKDHEKLGNNKSIGKGTANLGQLLKKNILKIQVELKDMNNAKLENCKLMLGFEYKDNSNSKAKPSITGRKSRKSEAQYVDDDDGVKKKETKVRSTKVQDFQIRIKVHEGRQLEGNNIDPLCKINCANLYKHTKKKRATNNPLFEEVFFFHFHTSASELLENFIEFQVFNSMSYGRTAIIGSFKLDLGYVYDEPFHSLISKWLLLSDPCDTSAGAKGYLKVTISIIGPGEEYPPNPVSSINDDIESNLLKPAGITLRPATFVMKLFRAEDLPKMDTELFQGIKRFFSSNEEKKELVDPYFKFAFAGKKVQSKIIYNNANPVYNQELRIGLKFPSMCEKITIKSKDWDRTSVDDTNAVIFLPLSLISDLQADGFLPTIGPCFINMYGAPREFSEIGTTLDELNLGKTEGAAYRGRVLLEIQTELDKLPQEEVTDINHPEVLKVDQFLKHNKYKLHAAFFDAHMIQEKEKTIQFEISIGNYGNKLEPSSLLSCISTTAESIPMFDGCNYFFLPWSDTKPCIQITSFFEDVSYRLEAINQIKNLKNFISLNLDIMNKKKEYFLNNKNIKPTDMAELAMSVLKFIEEIKRKARTPLPMPSPGKHHQNSLDRHLRLSREKALKYIISKCEKIPNLEYPSIVEELECLVEILKRLENDPQNSIPDVIIWMFSGNERTAYYRIPANDVFYSTKPESKGSLCGVFQTINLKWPGSIKDKFEYDILPAQLRLKLWFGFEREENDWIKSHADEETNGALSIFAETYENQAYSWTSLKWGYENLSRPSFSDASGKIAIPKSEFKIPDGWEWRGEWDITPDSSLLFDKDAGHMFFLEEVYEQTFRHIPGSTWMNGFGDKKPYNWTNYRGEKSSDKDAIELEPGWKWDDEWQVDLNKAVDHEGWEYCVDPSMGSWSPVEKIYHLNRRRRWLRNRSVLNSEDMSIILKKDSPESLKSSSEGWEYSTMFSTKFHPKPQTSDTVRRRRWQRVMQPIENISDYSRIFRFENNATIESDPQKSTGQNQHRLFLKFKKPNRYQLRAYIYQARSLPAADTDTSLSDPFCYVVFLNQSMKTEVIFKTLAPTWDQTLIFETIEIHGSISDIEKNPPKITIEIFDKDLYGDPDYLGRCFTQPIVINEKNKGKTKLEWLNLKREQEDSGELLACFELFLLDENGESRFLPSHPPKIGSLYRLPNEIRPQLHRTVIEILAWGLRNMKSYQLSDVDYPQIVFECGHHKIETEMMKNIKKNPNFSKSNLFFDIMLPLEDIYIPPISINVLDHRNFGRKPIIGVHTIKRIMKYYVERDKVQIISRKIEELDSVIEMSEDDSEVSIIINETKKKKSIKHKMKSMFKKKRKNKEQRSKLRKTSDAFGNFLLSDTNTVEEDIDWWCKFYASIGDRNKCGRYLEKGYEKIVVYNEELENQKKFEYLTDFCESFNLNRGLANSEEESEIVGEFKGMLKVYRVLENAQAITNDLIFKNVVPMEKEECLLYIYIIRGIDLTAKDDDGTSDPYIQIEAGKTKLDNKDSYIPNTNNPVFGRMFECKVVLPLQKDLCIRVYDYDLIGSDELIGETWIDLENRILTKYRATCGLQPVYYESGINKWRDSQLPSEILEDICRARNLSFEPPEVDQTTLKIGDQIFELEKYEPPDRILQNKTHLGAQHERLCLHVLKEFDLVTEHIETRKLYNPAQPDMEQGRLQMWVDIFPISTGPPREAFNITPRKSKKFVLRCIIWNTSEVPLDDVSITGEKMSDIYVKGWLQGLEEDKQKTDIHYRSLDGDGNFNWRFSFDFECIPSEQCIVVKKKEHFWSLDQTESKLPPIITFQIWDNDKFSADDFLGQLSLNLYKMVKPAKNSEKCGLHQLPENNIDKTNSSLSLFEQKRLKGWWPCVVELADNKREIAGKIELELEILTEEEAKERPAGRGREEPNQNPKLDPPNRPETSFLAFTSPWKTFKLILWRKYKWHIITSLFLVVLVIFGLLMCYTLPGALWNKMLMG